MVGITSYSHLDKVIIDYLKKQSESVSARQIYDFVTRDYSTNKVRINVLKIAKRLQKNKNVKVVKRKKGICYYQYNSTKEWYNGSKE